jgi:hypothetical protein
VAVIEPQPIVDAAQPWCCIPAGDLWYAVLGALIVTGNGDPMPTADELMADIACLKCAIQPGDVPFLILGAIAEGGGGGGGTIQVYTGAFADPNGNVTPDDPTKPALFYPTGGGTLWQWDGAAWV